MAKKSSKYHNVECQRPFSLTGNLTQKYFLMTPIDALPNRCERSSAFNVRADFKKLEFKIRIG